MEKVRPEGAPVGPGNVDRQTEEKRTSKTVERDDEKRGRDVGVGAQQGEKRSKKVPTEAQAGETRPRTGGSTGEAAIRLTATKFAFVLGVLCLLIVGYAVVAYVHFSFSSDLNHQDIALFIVRQRTALSALAMSVGVSCIVMGIAVFLISAKGETQLWAESTFLKGSLATSVPGPFFVLCGAAITVTVVVSKVSHEEFGPATYSSPSAPGGASASAVSATPSPPMIGRTIASGKIAGLLAVKRGVGNALFDLSQTDSLGDEAHKDLDYLAKHASELQAVRVSWDPANKRVIGDLEAASDQHHLEYGAEGVVWVFALESDSETIIEVLSALSSPGKISDESAFRRIRGALSDANSYNPRQDTIR